MTPTGLTELELVALLGALEYKRVGGGLHGLEWNIYRKLADEYKEAVDQFTTPTK
jgi:hypothetical protein